MVDTRTHEAKTAMKRIVSMLVRKLRSYSCIQLSVPRLQKISHPSVDENRLDLTKS